MTTQKSLTFFLLVLLLTIAGPRVFAEEAQPLPDDNLIENPWFRDVSNTTASHDGWEITESWGLSQKNSNPTFDDVVGTSARIGTPKASYNEDHVMSQVVAADATQPVLLFQMWQVSRNLNELKATFYGSDSPDGPWEEVWQPWVQQQSSVHWMQTPLFETELSEGYPYYKLELLCNYSKSIAGCKYSGVYFKVTDETGVGVAAGTAVNTPEPSSGNESDNSGGGDGRLNPNAIDIGLDSVTAVALSSQEIEIRWPEHDRVDSTYQIERSNSGRGSWEVVAQVEADDWSYIDIGLAENAEYFYRIQVHFDSGGRSRSNIFSATTLSSEPLIPTETAVEEPIIEPSPTIVVDAEPNVEPMPTVEPDESSIEPTPEPVDDAETAVETPSIIEQYGLLLIGFGLGALVVGGFWSLSRRKTN